MLSLFWFFLIISGFITAVYRTLSEGDLTLFSKLVEALFDMSSLGFDIALGLTGLMCLWLGLFKVAEASGLAGLLAKGLEPLLSRLMPTVPKGHPAMAAMTMNLGANVLGLDNAATPMGLKAMRALQSLNPVPTIASNPQILFLVLNTSSVTLLPMSVFLYRSELGAAEPTDVFIPIVLATSASTLVGLMVTGLIQRLPLLDPIVLLYLGGYSAALSTLIFHLWHADAETLSIYSSFMANFILMCVVTLFLLAGFVQKLDIYSLFISGAKQGFAVAIRIVPYLIAMLVAIGVFRASGALDILAQTLKSLFETFNWDTRFIDALPTALMKPFSGSGARALMVETMNHHGADSFAGRLASIMQGSTETTLYVLAVYFGSVGIRQIPHALVCGLIADGAGLLSAVLIAYWFFG